MGDVTDIEAWRKKQTEARAQTQAQAQARRKKHQGVSPEFVEKIGDEILKLNGLYVGTAIGLYLIKAASVRAGMKEGDELDTTFRWLGGALEKLLNE